MTASMESSKVDSANALEKKDDKRQLQPGAWIFSIWRFE